MFKLPLKTKKSGFSLIEVLTVLFIIALGLVGILSLIIQNIQSQTYNKSNLVAYQLAQEGIELIRNVRDSNWKAGKSFKFNLNPGYYYMDYRDYVPRSAAMNPTGLAVLKQDTNGYYFHDLSSVAPNSGFSRLLIVKPHTGTGTGESIYVTSRITWTNRGNNYTYDLDTILYDWK